VTARTARIQSCRPFETAGELPLFCLEGVGPGLDHPQRQGKLAWPPGPRRGFHVSSHDLASDTGADRRRRRRRGRPGLRRANILSLRRLVQGDRRVPVHAVVFTVAVLWVALNLIRWPRPMQLSAALIVLGASVNGLVMAANGGMPDAPEAAVQAHLPATLVGPRHPPADHGTRLAFHGDVIPLAPPGKGINAGDLLTAAGAAATVVMAVRGGAAAARMALSAAQPPCSQEPVSRRQTRPAASLDTPSRRSEDPQTRCLVDARPPFLVRLGHGPRRKEVPP
jgi:hypothetical protein